MIPCFHPSMMLLDGRLKNIIQMTNSPPVGRIEEMVSLVVKRMVQVHSLVLCGMKHLAIIMMLLLGSIMMEIQVGVLCDYLKAYCVKFKEFCLNCRPTNSISTQHSSLRTNPLPFFLVRKQEIKYIISSSIQFHSLHAILFLFLVDMQ